MTSLGHGAPAIPRDPARRGLAAAPGRVGTAAFFLLLTVKLMAAAIVGGVLALAMLLVWAWGSDPGPAWDPWKSRAA